MKKLLYFGCIREKGHYLYSEQGHRIHNTCTLKYDNISGVSEGFIRSIDGTYVPGSTQEQGVYQESFVPPFRIIAWHDYTVDSRPGSNSALLGIGYGSADEMIDDAATKFPEVISRQPPLRDVRLLVAKG